MKKNTKDLLQILFLLSIFVLVYIYKDNISMFILDNFVYKKEAYIITPNEYYLDYNYSYVKETDDFYAKNKKHILDIFYTYLNSGADEFYFFCEYDSCEKDVKELTDNNTFATINNFVSPYNTYNRIYISITSWGKVDVIIEKSYTDVEIKKINSKLNEIISNIIKDDITEKEKIIVIHDYIINNSKYDTEYIENNLNDINNFSHKATGTLLYSKSLCGGYSHTMSLFLNKLKIPNYRISSDSHIWNLVYIDGKWLHLDLTWDDPVTSNKTDVLLDKYLLIETYRLKEFNTGHHNFDETIYLETNQKY